jgi:hypothetical protein
MNPGAEEEGHSRVMLECVSLAAVDSRYVLFALNSYLSMKQYTHFYVTSAGTRPNTDLGSTASPS